ncbi:caspase family protein (plasmid) [Leclercia pneumoniae]|uniref:caspase family protein n=1 Tax=Atlantibacter hermannii TaxID=565 RepID=UPI0028B1B021|nr:caspase family protein [Atlantibacter hermannii]
MAKPEIKYDNPKLDANYDYVGIIDGLSCDDRKEFGITTELGNLLRSAQLPVKEALVNTKQELLDALNTFLRDAQDDQRFMLHFVAHGNEQGIQIGTDFVTWEVLRPHLQEINVATERTLLLNMSTCKGLHGVKIVDSVGEYPFFGLIGAKDDLDVSDALNANKIMYRKWLNDLPVQEIVPETNAELGKVVLFNISSEGFRKLTNPE